MNNQESGKLGEEAAVNFLKEKGYKILSRNFKTKLGEVDVVARDRDTYCFIEVKSRNSDRFGLAQEAVSVLKQRQISKAALGYLKENRLLNKKARFDVVSIMYQNNSPVIDLIKNAFELDGHFTY
jgi:putative endonuclease